MRAAVISLALAALFAWMFRYDMHDSGGKILRLDRWTGELQFFAPPSGWVNYNELVRPKAAWESAPPVATR